MKLRVKTVYFKIGISMLGGTQSVTADELPGVKRSSLIERYSGGFLVEWQKRLWHIPDSQVECAEVEHEEDYTKREAEKAAAVKAAEASQPKAKA